MSLPDDDEPPSWDELLGGRYAPGDVMADKYRLDALIGVGAMGFVVRAHHTALDEDVAVKFLRTDLGDSEEALARFEREARAAFRIKSPHVARVLDVGRDDSGQPFMVMEFLHGLDLADRLAESTDVELESAVTWVLQAAEAIAEAHSIGVVHRDLKPENLFLAESPDGRIEVKVLDFGLSKLLPGAEGTGGRQRALTQNEQAMGTAYYMSPEQWRAAKHAGPSSDIWALGVILYELVAGRSPFERETIGEICKAVLSEPQPPIDDPLPEGLEDAIAGALGKTPDERYPTVAAFAAALAPFAGIAGETSLRRIRQCGDYTPRSRDSVASLAPASEAPASSAPASSVRGPISAPVSSQGPPASSSLEPLPRLGVLGDDGFLMSWREILAEPAPAPSRAPWIVGVLVLIGAAGAVAYALSSGAL